jgi:hypothetical protein
VIVPLITFPKSGMPTENSEIYKCKWEQITYIGTKIHPKRTTPYGKHQMLFLSKCKFLAYKDNVAYLWTPSKTRKSAVSTPGPSATMTSLSALAELQLLTTCTSLSKLLFDLLNNLTVQDIPLAFPIVSFFLYIFFLVFKLLMANHQG